MVEVDARVGLGKVNEALRPRVSVPVLHDPVAKDLEEGRTPDLLAQGLQGHRPADVDRRAEELRGAAGVAERRVPESGRTGRGRVLAHEALRYRIQTRNRWPRRK